MTWLDRAIGLAAVVALVLALVMAVRAWRPRTLNVEDHRPQGGTDQQAIQAAVDAARGRRWWRRGDTVYLPTGTYQLDGPLPIKSGITIRGAGGTARWTEVGRG